jgi:flagellar protein FlbD
VIEVTRLGGGTLVVNAALILTIEQTPDTIIGFTNGEKLLVRESPEEVVERAVEFQRRTRTQPGLAAEERPADG